MLASEEGSLPYAGTEMALSKSAGFKIQSQMWKDHR